REVGAGRPSTADQLGQHSSLNTQGVIVSEFNNIPGLTLLPAVDIADGKAVRLTQGEAGTETSYGDPVDAAADWIEQGAEWIHLVDLDAAFGRGENRAEIKRVTQIAKDIHVELSGGIRDDESLEA